MTTPYYRQMIQHRLRALDAAVARLQARESEREREMAHAAVVLGLRDATIAAQQEDIERLVARNGQLAVRVAGFEDAIEDGPDNSHDY